MMDRFPLLSLIAGCLAFASIIFIELEPVGKDDPATVEVATRHDAGSTVRRQQNPRLDELLTATLARPLFSSTRRPPQGPANDAAGDDLKDTRLTGIVTEPGTRIAIFSVNGAKPLKVIEGESVNGWRVESITPREVSLSGPSGAKTLQPKVDPNLVPSPGQPPPGNIGGRFPTTPAAAAAARLPAPPTAAAAGQPTPAPPINPAGMPPRPARLRQQR